MKLTSLQKEFIINADAKALATYIDQPHVIPVSTIFLSGDHIVLCNYFMNITPKNIIANSQVALSAWRDMEVFQVKGSAEYRTEGELFEEIKHKIHDLDASKVLKGIIIISPKNITDIH